MTHYLDNQIRALLFPIVKTATTQTLAIGVARISLATPRGQSTGAPLEVHAPKGAIILVPLPTRITQDLLKIRQITPSLVPPVIIVKIVTIPIHAIGVKAMRLVTLEEVSTVRDQYICC